MIPDHEIPDHETSDHETSDHETSDHETSDHETSDHEMPVPEQIQSFPGAFCEPCNKWRKPNALLANGNCPRCGTQLDENAEAVAASAKAQDAPKIPWHFWVMVAATALYLGWRVFQGLQSLF